jgi:predicted aldo/keto reductase-like oxidoreductase
MVSVVGFPGLALSHCSQDESDEGIRDAFEKGVNYFDVAPAYGEDGECEIKMGIGLQQLDRGQIFLASKTKMRDREGARKELERSLRRLKTDHLDLYQLHHLWDPADVEKVLGPGGAMETVLKAREEGKIRHVGFSAHTTKAALDVMKGFRFDTVMFPINFVEYFKINFGREVIELANQQGAALLSIKTLSHGRWPEGAERARKWWYRSAEEKGEVDLALRFALSLKGVVVGIPPSFLDLLDKAILAGKSFRPITDDETAQLQALSASCLSLFKSEEDRIARGGPFEPIYPESPYEDRPPCSRA